jgi:hypothetical protein
MDQRGLIRFANEYGIKIIAGTVTTHIVNRKIGGEPFRSEEVKTVSFNVPRSKAAHMVSILEIKGFVVKRQGSYQGRTILAARLK